jgi:outer membrane protein assembly factor BamA
MISIALKETTLWRMAWLLVLMALELFILKTNAQSHIDSIQFVGLKKTQPRYLYDRISSRPGVVDELKINEDTKRLINLPQIYMAKAMIDSSSGRKILVFDITESSTFFPSVYFGLIRDNVWFKAALEESNFLGLGQQLYFEYGNIDSRHNFNLRHRAQHWVDSRLGYSAGFSKYSSIEPLYFEQQVFYDYSNLSAIVSIIYNVEERHFLELSVNPFLEKFNKSSRHLHEMTEGPEQLKEKKALLSVVQSISRINYESYYLDGWGSRNTFQLVRNFSDDSWFKIGISESKYFKKVGKSGNVATRLRLGISDNTSSPFAPFVLDSYFNIRGVGNRIDRGTATITLNLEYRHTVIDWNWLAVQVVGFSDLGTWRTPGGSFDDFTDKDVLKHFVGGGVRLIYKYAFDKMLRIDYGMDIYDKSQRGWVIGVGQYF